MGNDISLMRKRTAEAQHCFTNLFASFKMKAGSEEFQKLSFEACPTPAVCFVWGCFHCMIDLMQGVVAQIAVLVENEVNVYIWLSTKKQHLNPLLNIFISSGTQSC